MSRVGVRSTGDHEGMDSMKRTCGLATYVVEVSGSWLDPRTRTEEPHTETFQVLAQHPDHAHTAGYQLYDAAAAEQSCVASGKRFVRARA